jgi:8-oxo-dGTP diphosphatase
MIISTAAVIFNKNGILLGKRKPGGTLGNKWEFPGGKTKKGETPENGLKRELKEELGISVIPKELISTAYFKNKNNDYKLLAYYCIFEGGKISNYEHAEIAWVNPDEITKLNLADSDRLILPAVLNYLGKAK